MIHFSLDYTFWLNMIFGLLALYLFWTARRQPIQESHCEHHGGHAAHHHHHG